MSLDFAIYPTSLSEKMIGRVKIQKSNTIFKEVRINSQYSSSNTPTKSRTRLLSRPRICPTSRYRSWSKPLVGVAFTFTT
jgi:hypothetical protein